MIEPRMITEHEISTVSGMLLSDDATISAMLNRLRYLEFYHALRELADKHGDGESNPTDEQCVGIMKTFAHLVDDGRWFGNGISIGTTDELSTRIRDILRGDPVDEIDEPTSTKAFDAYGMYPTRGE